MTQGARPGVPRRTVLAGLVGAALVTSGCGIRLEDDAPAVPLVPTRTPVPAEAELVALTRDTASLAALAATVPGAVAADLATIHRRQHSVLRTTLLAAQVPADDLDATASPGATGSPQRVRGRSVGVAVLRRGAFRAGRGGGHVGRRGRHLRRGGARPAGDDGLAARPAVRRRDPPRRTPTDRAPRPRRRRARAGPGDLDLGGDLLPRGRGRPLHRQATGPGRHDPGRPARAARRPAGRRGGARRLARPPPPLPGRGPAPTPPGWPGRR